MNPMLLLGAVALIGLAMSGKKSGNAASPKPVKVVVPPSDGETQAIAQHAEATASEPSEKSIAKEVARYVDKRVPSVRPLPKPVPAEADPGEPGEAPKGGLYTVKRADGTILQPNELQARRSAQATADHVRNKRGNYSRPLLAAWQGLAGIASDGIYGPQTVAALRRFGAKNVVGAMFKGAQS